MRKYLQALVAELRDDWWENRPTWSEADEGEYFAPGELAAAEAMVANGNEADLPFPIGVYRRAAARNVFATYLVCWWEWAGLLHVYTLCRIHGHEWVDDSYGGPETGCMAGHCSRCGHSFHTTLY